MSFVRSGSFDSVDRPLEVVFRRNFLERRLSPTAVDELLCEMKGTPVKLYDQVGSEQERESLRERSPARDLRSMRGVDEIVAALRDAYRDLWPRPPRRLPLS